MKRHIYVRRLTLTLAIFYAVYSLYTLLSRALNLFLNHYGTIEILTAYLNVNAGLSIFLFSVIPFLLLLGLCFCSQGRRRLGLGLMALGEGLDVVRYFTATLLNNELTAMNHSLIFSSSSVLALVIGLLLMVFSQPVVRELRVCGVIAAIVLFLRGITTVLSLVAGIMLTGEGYLRLWVAVLSYAGTAGFLLGVMEGILVGLSFLLLLFSLREQEKPSKRAEEAMDTTEQKRQADNESR